MKVTLTGAAGFLGSSVCRALLDAGHEVHATDIAYRNDLPVRLDVADLLDTASCYKLVEGSEAVVHLGNHPGWWGRYAQRVFNENVQMDMNVFQAALEVGARLILFASSIQTIGSQSVGQPLLPPYLPLDSDVPARPRNPYALSKQTGEVMLDYYCAVGSLSAVAVRFPMITAPQRRPRWGPGAEEAFAFLDIADAARLVVAILAGPRPGFRIYLPAARANALGRPAADVIREHYSGVTLKRPIEEIDSLVDISRIREETGWEPAA